MGEMVPIAERQKRMRVFFEARKGEIGNALARVGVTPDRIIRCVFTAAQKNPQLYNCTPDSTYKAVLLAAQAGLMPDGVTQQAHLIPRMNRKRKDADGKPLPEAMECNLQLGYRGLQTLCRRSGDVDVFSAYLVRLGDTFDFEEGVAHHKVWKNADGMPSTHDDAGNERKVIGVWSKARFKSGVYDYDFMPIAEVEALKRRALADTPAWSTDYGEMVKKTMIRRHAKRLPQSEDMARLLELDAQADTGEPQTFDVPGVSDEPIQTEAEVRDAEPATTAPAKTATNKQDDEFLAGLGD